MKKLLALLLLPALINAAAPAKASDMAKMTDAELLQDLSCMPKELFGLIAQYGPLRAASFLLQRVQAAPSATASFDSLLLARQSLLRTVAGAIS